jgi:hypothetical protein
MPGIGSIEILGAQKAQDLTRRDRNEIERPSPDERFVLRLSGPWEFAMGAEVWGGAQLLERGEDVTSQHHLSGGWLGILKDGFLYPWNHGSDCLSLPVLDRERTAALVLYDVAARSERHRFDDVWPFGVVWSPTTDTAFLLGNKGTELFDTSGRRRSFPCGPVGSLFAGWTPSGRHITLPLGECPWPRKSPHLWP